MTAPVVVCGAYNEEAYLPETIPAILAQTYTDFRLLLVDNGSTDETWDWMQSYAARDSRVVTHRVAKNLGSGEGTHVSMGLVASYWPTTAWVVWHGADDIMHQDYLEALVKAAAEHPTVNYIFSPWRWLDHPDRGVRQFPPYDPATIATQHQIPNWAMLTMQLWRESGGFDRSINAGADWDWAVRASLMGLLRPYQLEKPYLQLRVREGRKSHSDEVDFDRLFKHMQAHTREQMTTW